MDHLKNGSDPPKQLKPLRMPRTAWAEEESSPESSQTPSTSTNGREHLLSPPVAPGVRTALPGESASIERTPESSNVEDLKDAIDDASGDGVKSPSVSSASSKRTSVSAEFTAQIRQKIRQQAKSMVQKKRGSVQLAKRLLRSQTLNTNQETEIDVGDQEAIDRQIEETIEAGRRFSLSNKTADAPESTQKRFFEFKSSKREKDDNKPTKVFFNRSLTRPQKDIDKFKSMITTYGRKRMEEQVEDPYTKNAGLFAAVPGRDLSCFFQRQGHSYPTSKEAIVRLNGIITHSPLRLDRGTNEEIGLTEYQKAINWTEWDVHTKRNAEYSTLDFDLNRIEFDHHWMFTSEDKAARKVKTLHHEVTTTGSKLLEAGTVLDAFKEVMGLKVLSESQKLESLVELHEHQQEVNRLREEYLSLSRELDRAYDALIVERNASKTPSTFFLLRKIFIPEVKEPWQQLFEDIPLYFIDKLEQSSQKNSRNVQRVRVQALIFFNDILVCKTAAVNMHNDFSVEFRKIYQLRVYEPPTDVYVIIREMQPVKGWIELGRVYLPLPEIGDDDKKNDEDTPKLEEVEFASELVVEKTMRYLGCGLANKESPNLSGRIVYDLRWAQTPVHDSLRHLSRSFRQEQEQDLPFELIPSELRLVSDEEMALDLRLEALSKRYSGTALFSKGAQRIGITSAEVDAVSLVDESRDADVFGVDLSMDSVRRAGVRYAAKIRSHLMESFAQDHRLKTFHDVVSEFELPTSFSGFGTVFGPVDLSRPLKPMRLPPSKGQPARGQLKLVVNIQNAVNLPERLDKHHMNVLVECAFQNKVASTVSVTGRNPNWQQTLVLNMDVPHDGELDFRTVVEQLELNIYDQQVHKLPSDDREVNTVHEQVEKTWLGTVYVPFSTVYSIGKVDGVLAIKEPLFSSEYRPHRKRAYLKTMITLDPPAMPTASSNDDNFMPSESASILADCHKFESRNRQLFPDRRYVGLVNDPSARKVAAVRYIRPLKPPHHVQEMLTTSGSTESAVQLAAHIVSCIPFVADPAMFPGLCDLWTTAEQLLTIGCGDEEEHAVLLTCWLLSLQLTAVLVLGRSLPEGAKGAYVLVQVVEGRHVLVNPADGNVYDIQDAMCPLVSIGTVITADNCYGNIQKNSHPSNMDFDLKVKSNWDPLFSTPKHDLVSVQPDGLTYTAVNEDILVELRSNLEREIKLRFDETRPYAIPQWNLMASRALREILMEYDSGKVFDMDIGHRLSAVLSSYTTKAVAFRCPYESRQQLVEQVLKTNMHVNSNKNTQFALSVHIQPFVNNIISCSVAVASLLPKYM